MHPLTGTDGADSRPPLGPTLHLYLAAPQLRFARHVLISIVVSLLYQHAR